jgi:hypothetical protein
VCQPVIGYISPVTKERWAEIGITIQFLIIVRTLGEVLRLKHIYAPGFTPDVAMQMLAAP